MALTADTESVPDVLTSPSSPPAALLSAVTKSARARRAAWNAGFTQDVSFVAVLACVAFLVLGYHPYAEDGGIYAAALAAKLNPTLFFHDRAWVTGHTQFSLFVPAVAATLQALHLSLPCGLLLLQIASLLATTGALLQLARLCFASGDVARWATSLVLLSAGLPIAGTSLYLIDPSPTARSVTTPLLVLAVSACLRRHRLTAMALWVAALAFHALMAAWGALPLVLFCLPDKQTPEARREAQHGVPSWRALRPVLVFVAALLLTCTAAFQGSPAVDPGSRALAQTRAYWFLSQWHWYESLGVVLPLALLCAAQRVPPSTLGWTPVARRLAQTVALSAAVGVLIAGLFARVDGRTMAIARLQPLRTLHLFYAVFLLLFAGTILTWLWRAVNADHASSLSQRWRVAGLHLRPLLLLAGVATATPLVLMQRSLYASSGYFELPGTTPRNGWEQAFAWARDHTGIRELFALDANYTLAAGEDAQGFRAIALRSVLPDRAKDGGVAAVVPTLAPAWRTGSEAQAGLNEASDAERQRRLLPLGADWLILPAASITALSCPYANTTARVCRLR